MTKLLGNRLHLPARIMNILGLERFHDLPTVLPVAGIIKWRTSNASQRNRTNPLNVHGRSEEHTSELQSLMRISYAVFCLKKQKNAQSNTQHQSYTVNTTSHI